MKRALSLSAALVAFLAIAAPRAQASCDASGPHTVLPGGLQTALNAIPPTVGPGDYCILLNNGVYNETLSIGTRAYADANSRIIISSNTAQNSVVIQSGNPTGGLFTLDTASVTLNGLFIKPITTTNYGILVTGPFAKLSHVTVLDNGFYNGAAVSMAGLYGDLTLSSVTASSVSGLEISSTSIGATVSVSTFSSNGPSGMAAIQVLGSSSSVSNVYAQSTNASGAALRMSSVNTASVVDSTFSALTGNGLIASQSYGLTFTRGVFQAAGGFAFNLNTSYSNTLQDVTASAWSGGVALGITGTNTVVTNGVFTSVGGAALNLTSGASGNTVMGSSVTASGPGATAVSITGGAGGNTLTGLSVTSNQGTGLNIQGGSGNTVQNSTITANSPAPPDAGVVLNFSASNVTLSGSVIKNLSGTGLLLNQAFQVSVVNDQISASTTGVAGFGGAVLVQFSSTDTFVNDTVNNSLVGSGLYLAQSSSMTILNGAYTTFSGGNANGSVVFDNTHNSSITNAWLGSGGGQGLYLFNSSSNNISGLSVSGAGPNFINAALLSGAVANTIFTSSFSNTGAGNGLRIIGGGNNNITASTMAAVTGIGLRVDNSNSNAFNASLIRSSSGTAALLFTSNSNILNTSSIVTTSTGAFAAYEDLGGSANQLTYASVQALASTQAAVHFFSGVTSDSIANSTITALAGAGIMADNSSNLTVFATSVQGSTGVWFNNVFLNGGNGFYGDSITGYGAGKAGLAITNAPPGSLTTVNNSVVSGSGTVTYGLLHAGSPGSGLQLTSAVTIHGWADIAAGTVTASGNQTAFLGDLTLGPSVVTNIFASTFAFSGASEVPARAAQTVDIQALSTPAFDALDLNVASFTAKGNGFTAATFQDLVAGSTAAFAAATSQPYTFSTLNLRGGTGANQRVVLRSLTAGTAMKLTVFASTVTLAMIRDSDASTGSTIHANDGTSVDAGNNTNWNFAPQLDVELPGQTWIEGVGKSGSPSPQTAGSIPVTVRAVSNGHTTLNTSITVSLNGSQLYDAAGSQPLLGGTTVFNLVLPRGGVTHILTASSTQAYSGASYINSIIPAPGSFSRLLLLLSGESADPGSATGRTGTPAPVVAGIPYPVTALAADLFNNPVGGTDTVQLSTSGANLPQSQSLIAGNTLFSSVVFASSAAARDLVAMDLSNGSIKASTSTVFGVFAPTSSSPTVSVNIANNSIQTSLNGQISGTASDPTGVTAVALQLVRVFDQSYFDFVSGFTGAPVSTAAALSAPGGLVTNWTVGVADANLTPDTTYYLVVKSNNASGNQVTSVSTFTFSPNFGQVGSLGDGEGTAAVGFRSSANPVLASSVGCGPIIASMTFVTGAHGINNGGAIAVHLPDSWTAPTSTAASFGVPPVAPGTLVIQSPTGFSIDLNPTSQNNATFGPNWFVFRPNANIPPGASVTFKASAFTGGGPQAVGAQTFLFQTQGGPAGQFKAIASQPAAALNAGPADSLQFSNQQFMTLGPLQTSSTMQLVVNDACGNSTNTATSVTASFNAFANGSSDSGAQFYQGVPVNQIVIPGNSHASPNFYFVTSTPGPFFEQLTASATLTASVSFATRYAQVLASSVSITGVSVDTGTLAPGVKVATITPGSFSGAAVFNFTLSNPNTPWELIVSTSPSNFFPEIVHRNGYGQPGRSVTWNGITETTFPQTLVKPGGPYFVKVRVGGGVVEDNTLAVYMAPSAYVYGTVASTGAFAYVQAQGPNTSFANFAVASSTGYFEIFGLQNGGRYNIVATTGSAVNGQFVQLQTSSNNVTAANTGTNVGSIPFPTPTFLRLRVQIPQPAPFEFWGGFNAFSNTGQNAWGTLHYLAGLDKSDDGSQSFGAGSASTWTVVGVTPGTYNLQISLPQVSISSTLPNISFPAGTTTDLSLTLQRKANVYGWAVVPSSTQYGTWVSVQAQKAGDPRPTVFGGTFLQGYQFGVPQSSSVYSLFGLDPGSWTITARAPGFASASSSLFISSNSDVGDPVNGGLNLTLSSGTVLFGTLKITGDSSNLPQASNGGLTVYINAFNPQTYTNGFAQVFISTDAVLAQSTFSITGLDAGTYFLNTWVQGAQSPQLSVNVPPGGGNATLNLTVDNARAAVTVLLPPGAPDFTKVGMFYQGMNVQPTAVPNFAALPGVTITGSSATWISPKFSPGYFGFMAADTVHGTFNTAPVQISNSATTPVVIDLRGSTYTVSGTVVVAGNVDFNINGTAVSVSSVAGVLANAVPAEYCLAGHANSITSSTFHLELLPVARQGSYLTQPLMTVQTAGPCPTQLPFSNNNNGDVVNPLLAYVVSISSDGSFTIPNVPAGSYVLRVPTTLSFAGSGNELPPVHQFVSVTTSSLSGLTFTISRGVAVSGSLRLPPGLTASRGMQVSINDANGTPVKTSFVSFNNSNSAPYTLDRVPDGSYALVVQDFGYPRSFGARPVTLKVSGAAVNQDIQLVQTGVIKGKLAVQQFLPNSTTSQFVIVDAHNADQLPNSFSVYAEADPWFQGGRTQADNACAGNCGGGGKPSFDDNGQFSISGVLPGLYDIHFESHNDPTEQSTIRLVTSVAPGVSVNGGATTDIGTYNLTSALAVRGRVTDATTGNPIQNMPVTAQPSLSQNHDVDRPGATTDANGNYTLVGLDPATKVYDIYAGKRQDHSGAPPPPYELKIAPSVDVTSVAVQNFAMTPASFSISGLVKGVAGGPALQVPFGSDNGTAQLGAAIFLQKSGVQPHDNPIADVMEQTDPQGRFTVPSLTTGTYKLTVVSLGYTSVSQNVTITTQSVTVPTITLGQGATLAGVLRKPDGSNPSQREIDTMVAVTNNFTQLLVATLTPDSNANTYTNYSIAGFQPGVSYKILIFGKGGTSAAIAPAEGQNIVFSTTTETRSLDLVLRPASPYVFSKSKKANGKFSLRFELSQPLRNSRPTDNDLASILSTFSALGTLSNLDLDATRSILTAQYTPDVTETSFTVRLNGFSTQTDPDSLDPVNPQFVYNSTFSFFSGIDGFYANVLSNFNGGTLLVEDDNGRVAIPGGAFQVDASSSVSIGLALSNESLAGASAASAAGYRGAAANIKAMRYSGSAYPQEIFRAMAATPPQVSPFSGFYNILLPLGIRTALQKPVPLTISYSTSTDPTTLNLYWYNAAANAYVLQQDVTGARPVIDTLNHTITINVNHFSTFVMFNTGVAVITGNTFGGEFTVYNFPNPFDLSVKNVSAIHGAGGTASVRGTQISIGLPPDVSGDASIKIFNVAGEKVRTISLGTLQGGNYYYQPWDGRNDSGRDVASGVYIGQVKVGDKSKFFKMALIK